MVDYKEEIYRLIPHRPPFLWVDRIISQNGNSIETEKDIRNDLDVFTGHYPHHPILPGVLLCEAIFQSGALLIANIMANDVVLSNQVPVMTRIIAAKFKRQVIPGDTITMQVKLKEKVGSAWFMKGRLQVAGKTAVQAEFACTMVAASEK